MKAIEKVIILCDGGISSRYVYHRIKDDVEVQKVLVERKDRSEIIRRRIKRLGLFKVLGQLMFQASIPPLLARLSQRKIQEIAASQTLSSVPIPKELMISIDSVNSPICLAHLQELKADLIILCGTRILGRHILEKSRTPFVNIHTGITPAYRGVHGGYWALVKGRKDLFGVTLHHVNKGIDTGQIIAQRVIPVDSSHNFSTYPVLQMGYGLELLLHYLQGRHDSNGQIINPEESQLWYHPTLWTYLYHWLSKGIK